MGYGFIGLPKNEKDARKAFQEMAGDDGEVNYNGWCDYLERCEVAAGTGLGDLFGAKALELRAAESEKQERDAAGAERLASEAERLAAETKVA